MVQGEYGSCPVSGEVGRREFFGSAGDAVCGEGAPAAGEGRENFAVDQKCVRVMV